MQKRITYLKNVFSPFSVEQFTILQRPILKHDCYCYHFRTFTTNETADVDVYEFVIAMCD